MKNLLVVMIGLPLFLAFTVSLEPAQAQDGKAIFKAQKCYKCHGTEAQGSEGQAPKLKGGKFIQENSADEIKKVIRNGREGGAKKYKEFKKKMPKFETGKLSDPDLDALVSFLKSDAK